MSHVFDLPGELTIFSAAETRTALLVWLAGLPAESEQPIELDAGQVLDFDGAGVQLLCAFSALMSRRDRAWRLASPSDTLIQRCRTAGLSAWIDRHTGLARTEERT